MVNDYKIVNFNEYCQKCEYLDLAEHEDPCHECLNNPGMINSHKPLNFKEQTKKKKGKKNEKKSK